VIKIYGNLSEDKQMKKSITNVRETEELTKSIATELDSKDPDDAEKILDENTRGVHEGGSADDNSGASESSKS
jgi:hypothetical protein